MNTGKNTVIFSVTRHDATALENAEANINAVTTLEKVHALYKPANGVYNGHAEKSYVVVLPTPYVSAHTYDVLGAILKLVKTYKQDSYLYIDTNGHTTLENVKDGTSVPLPKLKEVPETEALARESYTELDGRYYVS